MFLQTNIFQYKYLVYAFILTGIIRKMNDSRANYHYLAADTDSSFITKVTKKEVCYTYFFRDSGEFRVLGMLPWKSGR